MRAAYLLLNQLDRGQRLRAECDPGHDEATAFAPMRNLVFERIADFRDQPEALEGFCLVLTGYLAIVADGIVPSAKNLKGDFDRRLAASQRMQAARGDADYQRFVGGLV